MPSKLQVPEWTKNPEARAYWQSVTPGIAARWTDDEMDQVIHAAELCPTCGIPGIGNAGFILQYTRQNGVIIKQEYVACPNPNCPVRATVNRRRYGEVSAASKIPAEYRKMTFEEWDKLMHKRVPKGAPHVMDKKRDALGAAKAFVAAFDQEYRFSRADAAARAGLEPDLSEGIDNAARLNSIVFSGTFGVGKTSLTCAIANALMSANIQVVYVRMDNFFLALRDTFNTDKKGDNEGKVINLYKSAPVLILDELPLSASDWQREVGGSLIDHRYSAGLPTLITTNLESPEALRNAWGRLIADRITAMAHWFVLGGVQLRPRYEAKASR